MIPILIMHFDIFPLDFCTSIFLLFLINNLCFVKYLLIIIYSNDVADERKNFKSIFSYYA